MVCLQKARAALALQRSMAGYDLPVLLVSHEDRRYDDAPIHRPDMVLNADDRRLVAQWAHCHTLDHGFGAREPRRELLLVNGGDRGPAGGEYGGCADKVGIGAAAGDLRTDVEAADVAATLAGVLAVAGAPDQRAQAGRMLDLVLDGLRPGAAGGSSRV